jgi:hypothetical protein
MTKIIDLSQNEKAGRHPRNQYHNPLAVEPESAKDAAAKLHCRFFLANRNSRPNQQKDCFKCSRR